MMSYKQLQQQAKILRSELPTNKQKQYKLNGKKSDLQQTYETLLQHTRFNEWINQLDSRSEILERKIESQFQYNLFIGALYDNKKLNRGKYLVVGRDQLGRQFDVMVDTNDKKRVAYRNLALKLGIGSDAHVENDFTVSVYKQEDTDDWATQTRQQQRFKEGEMNCLIQPLVDWYQERRDSYELKSASWVRYNKWVNQLIKLEAQVRDGGVTIDIIKQICKQLSVNIFIKNIMNNDRIVEKCVQNARKNFVFYNTKFEHVDHYFNEKIPESITSDKIHDLYDDLVKKNVAFMYKKSLGSISLIMIAGKSYQNENIFKLQEIYHNFQQKHDHAMVARYSERQFEFMASQITSNGKIQLRSIMRKKQLFQYDQNQAFSQFKQTGKYYLGFPIPTQFRSTPSQDPQFAITHLGNYECKVDLSQATDIAKLIYKQQHETIGLTSADINFLLDNRARIQLIGGCWGDEKYDFDFPKNMIDHFEVDPYTEYKIRPFSVWTGRQQIVEQQTSIFLHCDDPSLVYQSSDLDNERFYEDNNIYKLGKSQYEVELKKQSKNIYSRIHIATFILAYQRINLALQLQKMDLKKIVRIHTDGIYTYQELTQDQITPSYRREEIKKTPTCGVQETFIIQHESRVLKFPEYRDIRKTTLCLGLGGGGKTHVNLIDEGLISVLFVAPSNRLMTKKRQDYQQYNHKYTNYAVLNGSQNKDGERQFLCQKYNPRNIICDEGSLISIDTVKHTLNNYKFANVICCGDPKQLQFFTENESDDEFDPEEHVSKAQDTKTALEFKYEITYEFNTSYRCKDQNLLDVLLDVRENDCNLIHKLIDKSRQIKLEDFNQNPDKYGYDFNDQIICATRKLRAKINDTLKTSIKKYRVVKKHRFEGVVYYNGDYIEINDQSQLMKMITGKDGKPLKKSPILYQHAGTCHSLQGITAQGKLFICVRDLHIFDGYLYTALSRAQYLDQIYILV